MHRKTRGQAALEFLMTYSWAILVVIIIIGALAYFGVLNPQNLLPESCTLPAGFGCQDSVVQYTAADGTITLVITNAQGRAIEISSVAFAGPDLPNEGIACNSTAPATFDLTNGDGIVSNGATVVLQVSNADCRPIDVEGRVRAEVIIEWDFTNSPTGVPTKFARGEISKSPQTV